MDRPGWDEYFLEIARIVAVRCTCDRGPKKGCVLTKNNRILATGYAGSPPGQPHCDDVGHLMVNNHCLRTIHCERNALNFAARYGVPVEGATCYITQSPCFKCTQDLVSAGVVRIVVSKDTYHPEEDQMKDERERLFHEWFRQPGGAWMRLANIAVEFKVFKEPSKVEVEDES